MISKLKPNRAICTGDRGYMDHQANPRMSKKAKKALKEGRIKAVVERIKSWSVPFLQKIAAENSSKTWRQAAQRVLGSRKQEAAVRRQNPAEKRNRAAESSRSVESNPPWESDRSEAGEPRKHDQKAPQQFPSQADNQRRLNGGKVGQSNWRKAEESKSVHLPRSTGKPVSLEGNSNQIVPATCRRELQVPDETSGPASVSGGMH